jgi:hypothetical protein
MLEDEERRKKKGRGKYKRRETMTRERGVYELKGDIEKKRRRRRENMRSTREV